MFLMRAEYEIKVVTLSTGSLLGFGKFWMIRIQNSIISQKKKLFAVCQIIFD